MTRAGSGYQVISMLDIEISMLDIVELKPTIGLCEHVEEICRRDVKLGITVVEMLVSATALMRWVIQ